MMKHAWSTLVAAALAAPWIVGCGTQGSLGASVPGLPDDFKGPGTYTVPAVPTVQFPITSVDVDQGGGVVSVYYDLPAAFGAQGGKVHLTGMPDEDGTVELAGPAGTSTCTVAANLFECHEQLSGMHFDPGELPEGEGEAESTAVESFIVDPVGVLRVMLPE